MDDSLEKNEDEITLPKATIDKIISENSNKHGVTKDVKEILMHSCVEFIHFITSEANKICESDNKKTISHDHVYRALESLGYDHYIEACTVMYNEHIELNKLKPSRKKLKDSGMTTEELLADQTMLFKKAREELIALGNERVDDEEKEE